MTRAEAIKTIKEAESFFCKHGAYKDCHSKCKFKDALSMAIASLEVDEAYQLECQYEKTKALFGKMVKEEDCISRAEAIRVASGYCHPSNVAKELAKLPSVYPKSDKPIRSHWHGHWIDCDKSDDYSADGYDCSVCGVNAEYATSYCPNCGAKMVEPQESEDNNGRI